ncbi:MAG: Stp1/IreP family PP2C-type Ser/Thr phosphatase [Oscillospiraceae bacterium]|nr:Stp1/IreP family PP2C-type Ser/Thr phosphatase [Oscillospiraceae bacterium]
MPTAIAGKTDIGKKRSINEDNFHAEKINDIYLAVVCDGVGGAKAGNVASSIAVKSFADTFKESLASAISSKFDEKEKKDKKAKKDKGNKNENNVNYKDILIASVAKANGDIFAVSKENKETRGMGTTMVSCVFDGDEYYAVNVGDSRLYIVDDKNRKLNQITKDHSLVQELVDSGVLTKEQAEKSPNKNIITRVLGVEGSVDADFYRNKYASGIFLLCSDGLYNYIDENDIIKIISESDNLEFCLSQLIDKANENGGGDNITAIIIKT